MINFDTYVGQSFGEAFTVINIIGTGEYSVVFGAYDTVNDRTVAIKIQRPEYNDDPVVSERFATEVNILSLLDHPNIVKIYETHLDTPVRYFVMEYIEGITLKKHIVSRGALDTEEILFFSRQILSALAEVHSKGVVHSDIKPQNVVVLGDGSIRLMDFGIATLNHPRPLREVFTSDENDPTFGGIFSDDPLPDPDQNPEAGQTSGFAVGTVHYVSPEQAEGKPLDHLSDIYSFGVMLYEMTTGILPFFGESAQKIATMHVRLAPIPPSQLVPEVPEGLERIILRAMEKLPFARYASAAVMLEELNELAEELHAPKVEIPAEPEAPKTLFQRGKELILSFLDELSIPSLVTGLLCSLLVAVVIGLGILSDALVSERHDPRYMKIPDLVDREFSAAALSLDSSVYEINVTYEKNSGKQGRILEQSPRAGRVLRLGNGITELKLTVACRSLPPEMPDLRRMNCDAVCEILRAYDCTVTVIEQPNDYLPAGEIIATVPAAGEMTTRSVTLFVSAGWQENK